jgi:pimeloyl-ACP methyl ester carboxylesterase
MPSLNSTPIPDTNWRRGRAHISGAISTVDEVTLAYIDCPPLPSSSVTEKGTIVLIHGFPQTSYQFRHVITPLAEAGYRIIAPDYRGAGESSHPRNGFEKTQMAADIHALVHEHLGVVGPVHIVGHDIGGMVAHAYAAVFPKETASVTWGECPLPGTSAYDEVKFAPETFHFSFHWQPDLPELLVTGKEKQYLKHFYTRHAFNHAAINDADWDHFAAMYSVPGGLRCGFDCYRAFATDAKENTEMLKKNGKCQVPAMALNGGESIWRTKAYQVEEMYQHVDTESVPGSGHWIAEENPEAFVEKVLSFVAKHS